MFKKFFCVIFSLVFFAQGFKCVFAENDVKDLNLEKKSSNLFCTEYRRKDSNTSIFLDLRGSDFKDAGSVKVSIYGRNSSGNERNCTYKAEYYILEAGRKYHLYNWVKERGYEQYDQVQLRFTCTEDQVLRGCWAPDSGNGEDCLRIGDTKGTGKITTDKNFDYIISSDGECWTTIRTKASDSSVYLNLEASQGESVDVSIFGVGGLVEFENCTNRSERFELALGKKYQLYNCVKENGHSGVQLRFIGTSGQQIKGKWSPDFSPEDGCILVKSGSNFDSGATGVNIRPIPHPGNPGSVELNVAPISQKPEFPTGCESVSAVMLLNFYGCRISVNDFINDYLIKKAISENPDPFSAFVGDPRGNGYGCFAPVIAKAMNKVLSGKVAEVVKGKTLFQLAETYVRNGNPILIWATIGMKKSYPGDSWIVNYVDENASKERGERYTWPKNEHCLVLIGFNDNDFFVNDPYQNSGNVAGAYGKNLLQQRFSEMGSQAVVVK